MSARIVRDIVLSEQDGIWYANIKFLQQSDFRLVRTYPVRNPDGSREFSDAKAAFERALSTYNNKTHKGGN